MGKKYFAPTLKTNVLGKLQFAPTLKTRVPSLLAFAKTKEYGFQILIMGEKYSYPLDSGMFTEYDKD